MEGKSSRKVPGGKLVRTTVRYDEEVESVEITGDFFLYPEDAIDEVEDAFLGAPVDEDEVGLSERAEEALLEAEAELVGVGPDDVALAVKQAIEEGEVSS